MSKNMSKTVIGEARRTFVSSAIKGIDSKAKTIRAYASTSAWDRYGERFAPDAFKDGLDNFKKNPVILFAHDYSQAPIAKAIGYEFDEKGLILTMKFADTPKAQEVFGLYEGGFMNAFSVGFRPLEMAFEERVEGSGDMGAVFVRAELLENSAVPVPANPEAVVIKGLGDKSMTLSGALLREMIEGAFGQRAPIELPAIDPIAIEKMMPDAMGHLKKAVSGMSSHMSGSDGDGDESKKAAGCSDPSSMGEPMGHVKAALGIMAAMAGKVAPAPVTILVVEDELPAESLKKALGELLRLGKSVEGKVSEEATRSLLVQANNLCRELVYGRGAQTLDGMEGELSDSEIAGLVKEFELLSDVVMKSGKATEKDVEELKSLGKFIEERIIAAK